MPKTNTVSAFRCIGTWRRLWLNLNYCQGFISVKLFSYPVAFCPRFLLSFHLFLARTLRGSIVCLKKLWCGLSAGWPLLTILEALEKRASPLLEVQSDRDTGEVLIKSNVKCMGFFAGRVSELPPRSFQLNRFHFCSQVMWGGRSEKRRRWIQSSLGLHTATVVSTGNYWDHKPGD